MARGVCNLRPTLCPRQEGSEVFVHDYSNNGTFVDGVLIGKDKKLPLVNNAVISLSGQRNKGARPGRLFCLL